MILENIKQICELLDDMDEFNKSAYTRLSVLDQKISDLYHYLENTKLNYRQCYKFCKELKGVLIERRKLKRNMDIYKCFNIHKQKLINGTDNRQMLLKDVHEEDKKWDNPYKNNIYNPEELKKLVEE